MIIIIYNRCKPGEGCIHLSTVSLVYWPLSFIFSVRIYRCMLKEEPQYFSTWALFTCVCVCVCVCVRLGGWLSLSLSKSAEACAGIYLILATGWWTNTEQCFSLDFDKVWERREDNRKFRLLSITKNDEFKLCQLLSAIRQINVMWKKIYMKHK